MVVATHTNLDEVTFLISKRPFCFIGSFSNDDSEVNEIFEKAISLGKQNNKSARVSRFFVHFFAVTARLRRENT